MKSKIRFFIKSLSILLISYLIITNYIDFAESAFKELDKNIVPDIDHDLETLIEKHIKKPTCTPPNTATPSSVYYWLQNHYSIYPHRAEDIQAKLSYRYYPIKYYIRKKALSKCDFLITSIFLHDKLQLFLKNNFFKNKFTILDSNNEYLIMKKSDKNDAYIQ